MNYILAGFSLFPPSALLILQKDKGLLGLFLLLVMLQYDNANVTIKSELTWASTAQICAHGQYYELKRQKK